LFLSVGSIWELAIKTTKQKLELSEPLKTYLTRWTTTYQINVLAIEFPHALKVAELADHHRNPFDRILIAQAMVENMALVSGDDKFNMYPVPVIW
jgi:PIN domain nuclease of toxin-antitoxin system